MTDNTPLNADDELRKQIIFKLSAKLAAHTPLGDTEILNAASITAHLLPLILADRKKHELEARIDETSLWYNDWGMSDETIGDGSWEDFYEYRIATLKQELEKHDR